MDFLFPCPTFKQTKTMPRPSRQSRTMPRPDWYWAYRSLYGARLSHVSLLIVLLSEKLNVGGIEHTKTTLAILIWRIWYFKSALSSHNKLQISQSWFTFQVDDNPQFFEVELMFLTWRLRELWSGPVKTKTAGLVKWETERWYKKHRNNPTNRINEHMYTEKAGVKCYIINSMIIAQTMNTVKLDSRF